MLLPLATLAVMIGQRVQKSQHLMIYQQGVVNDKRAIPWKQASLPNMFDPVTEHCWQQWTLAASYTIDVHAAAGPK